MILIRCHTVSGVALSTVQGETRLLMMKRVKGGFWCHVAGTVEAGETGWQTIVREFREETGIVVHELYNGQYLEQFYEHATNTVCLVPVFVVYLPANAGGDPQPRAHRVPLVQPDRGQGAGRLPRPAGTL